MVYEPKNWKAGDTITSAGMNNIEAGILANDVRSSQNANNISILESKSDSTDLSHSQQLDALWLYYRNLETKVNSLPKINSVTLNVSSADNQTVSSNKPVYISESLTGVSSVSSEKSIAVEDSSLSNGRLSLTASETVLLNNLSTSGDLQKATSNSAISINNNDDVHIHDCKFGQTSYNCVEIGLSNTSVPGDILIENCVFTKTSNNSILIFNTKDNATITVKNCTFVETSNPVRLSNRDNVSVTLNLIDCDFQKIDDNPQYRYVVLCQDYTSADAATSARENLFAPEKVKINFENCTLEGSAMTADKAVYVYRDKGGGLISGSDVTPEVTIK